MYQIVETDKYNHDGVYWLLISSIFDKENFDCFLKSDGFIGGHVCN